jgi:long chain fatty acid CoA FadD26
MAAVDFCIPAVLAERLRQQPEASAYTFVDYEVDPDGFVETLTWSQVGRRVQLVADELSACASPGDRVAICAPQGLEYIVGFLGALHAGLVAVPLSAPMFGVHDERVSAVLADSAPAAVLTTSTAVDGVAECVRDVGGVAPAVIEIDALDLEAPVEFRLEAGRRIDTALLQYTSGSTRAPTGVVVTHKNLLVNLDQIMSDFFEDRGKLPPPDATPMSWLPFYHDMGLMFGVFIPLAFGLHAVLMSPMAFLQKPARWIQQLASWPRAVSPAPNFAFELAVRRTSDADMVGLDLGNVLSVISGAERVHAATIRRFTERFDRFNLPHNAARAAYGLAEATVYVASSNPDRTPEMARFDSEKLSAGYAKRCGDDVVGVELVSHGVPRACTVRIADPDTCIENPAGRVGEIWIHGDNVSSGYWRNPQQSERTVGARLGEPSAGTPARPWLRSGDLGVICDGDLFIIGRIKDVLIVDGRNHYPDDIEATIQEITGGRVAAISVQDAHSEQLVTVVEFKNKGSSEQQVLDRLHTVKREVASTVSKLHGLRVTDLVLVAPGSIPITTSGKIRRSACADLYQHNQFTRVDTPA